MLREPPRNLLRAVDRFGLASRLYVLCFLSLIIGQAGQVHAQTGELAPAQIASADVTSAEGAWHFQYDLFQLLLQEQGLAELPELDLALAAPPESVIVIAGVTRKESLPWEKLNRFVEDGGTLFLASDSLMSVPGIGRFMPGPVTATEPGIRYRTYSDCVRVSEISNVGSMFTGVFTIVTNRSSWFLPDARGPFTWETVAKFPRGCLPEASQGKPLLALGRPASGGRGVILVSADASLVTNGMLWHGDNAVLAIRIGALLSGKRKSRLVFIAEGQVLGDARDRLPPRPPPAMPNADVQPKPPEPRLSQLLNLGNAVAKEVVDSNVLNEALKQQPRNLPPSRYFRILLGLMTVGLVGWALWRLVTNRLLRPIQLRRRKMRSAYELRSAAGDDSGDYRQPAGYLAREFCRELTGSRSSADWQKYAAKVLSSTSSVSAADQRELIRIIDIASRGHRAPMTGSDFQQLGKTIAALRIKHCQA